MLRNTLKVCGLGTVWYVYPRQSVSDNLSMNGVSPIFDEALFMNTISSLYTPDTPQPSSSLPVFSTEYILSFLSLLSFGVIVYSPYLSMDQIPDCVYGCMYTSLSAYTRCTSLCEKLTHFTKSVVYVGYQYVAPSVEWVARTMDIPVPDWLQSEETRREWIAVKNQLVHTYPWVGIYSSPDGWEKKPYKTLDTIHTEDTSSSTLRFVLFRVLRDGEKGETPCIYRRFNTLDDARTWNTRYPEYEQAKEDVLSNYVEEHPFLELTPRNRNISYDWRETIRPFAVKGNMILDREFIEWCLHAEEHTLHDHYPITYIDSNIQMGQLGDTHHVIVGEGVKEPDADVLAEETDETSEN